MTKTFIWPTDTKRITSKYGPRKHPITGATQSFHNGVDIAQSGSRPIYAVADGLVRRSYLSSSYGETIMIKHSINGLIWESVYAHMRSGSRKFRVGDKVKQGDVIGFMGSTGNSTGQHLHFELHKKGLWNIKKSNSVNPEDYLDKNLNSVKKKSNKVIAQEVIDGKWGNGNERTLKLGRQGYNPVAIQKLVNQLINNPVKKSKTVEQMAKEIIDGKHGNGHSSRQKSLGISNAEYAKVKKKVNELAKKKTINQMAIEIIAGKHGNGHKNRRKSLGISESEYEKVKREVNRLL